MPEILTNDVSPKASKLVKTPMSECHSNNCSKISKDNPNNSTRNTLSSGFKNTSSHNQPFFSREIIHSDNNSKASNNKPRINT